jgi:hypothetical protein
MIPAAGAHDNLGDAVRRVIVARRILRREALVAAAGCTEWCGPPGRL